ALPLLSLGDALPEELRPRMSFGINACAAAFFASCTVLIGLDVLPAAVLAGLDNGAISWGGYTVTPLGIVADASFNLGLFCCGSALAARRHPGSLLVWTSRIVLTVRGSPTNPTPAPAPSDAAETSTEITASPRARVTDWSTNPLVEGRAHSDGADEATRLAEALSDAGAALAASKAQVAALRTVALGKGGSHRHGEEGGAAARAGAFRLARPCA
ncbi:MAG: hypothetical protein HON62_06355, partial [Rhodospirillaceae bacterium]|nr:hypothetical protein [Rhodospirillaceae bacterium]